MKDLTIELTTDDLTRLMQGAERFGTFATAIDIDDATVWLTVISNHKKPRKARAAAEPPEPPKVARAGANLGEAGTSAP